MIPPVVVMGVTGSGKSTVGLALAQRLGVHFVDADDLHPESNVAKMAAGIPLDGADRAPWLAELARTISSHKGGLILTCSALKREYRRVLASADETLVFAHLDGPRELFEARMTARTHFMPVSLLNSQLAALEALDPDESGWVIEASLPITEIVDAIVGQIGAHVGKDAEMPQR